MNKGKTIIVWILIILLLGVIGSCVYRIVDRLNGNTTEPVKTEEKQEEKKKEEQNNIAEEKELEDGLAKKDVYEKLNLVLGLNCSLGDTKSEQFSDDVNFITNGWIVYCDDKQLVSLFGNKLVQNNKLAIALSSTNSSDIFVDEVKNIKDENVKKHMVDFPPQKLAIIKTDDVKAKYKEIFNEDINSFNSIEHYSWYSYYYDAIDKIYYKTNYAHGGAGPLTYSLYLNKITQQGDRVYVYMNFVRALIADTNSYDDTIDTKLFSSDESETFRSFKIDETNYKEFKNYRIVFKKNVSGTYSYEKTEIVK